MNKQHRSICILLVLFAGLEIHAAGQSPEGFKLKNRSTFSSAGNEHDPFWPIGWVKPAAVAPAAPGIVNEVQFSTDGFVLTSVLLGQPALAVINGREYAEGEAIPCEMGGQKLGIQLAAIQDGAVVLRYRDKCYTVFLRRKGEEQKQIAKTEEAQSSLTLH